jgi:hypothetical protein
MSNEASKLNFQICAVCRRRGGLARVEGFAKEKLSGLLCKKCLTFKPDPTDVLDKVTCDCGKTMGIASRRTDIIVDGKLIYKGPPPKKYFCHDCSAKRIANNIGDPECLTRRPVMCCGGCGKQQAWDDTPEGMEPNDLTNVGSCMECEKKLAEVARNSRSIDDLVKNVSG